MTGAMSPRKKESAYLHLPTYTAGILYHLGTFLGILIFFTSLAGWAIPSPFLQAVAVFLALSGLAGAAILVKRIWKKGLRSLSLPDDYLSNLLVTGFHLLTATGLLFPRLLPLYYLWCGFLLLYIPFGKLRHLLYFFAARVQLGYFFGWRDSWPPKKTV